jgi:hypothetical protein
VVGLAETSSVVLACVVLGGCAAAATSSLVAAPQRERVIETRRASGPSSDEKYRDRPFEPRGGVVILGPEGRLIVMQLWEGTASPESACPSGLPATSGSTFRDVATLHVMPSPGPKAPSKANGYRFDEDTFAVFSGRLFERNLRVSGVRLPAKLEGGTTISVPVGVTDVSGTSVYEGRVRMFVCDLSK